MRSFDVVAFGEPLEKAERPTAAPTGTEVRLRVRAAGVCHTDLHLWDGFYDLGGGKRLSLADRGIALPVTMGHETVGEVIALGPEAQGVALGQTRLIYPWIGCGACPACRHGRENHCAKPRYLGIFRAGGYADEILVPHPRYLVPLHGLSPEQAAPFACSGLTTYSALRKVDPDVLRDEPIVVVGAGGLGLMCLSLLPALGARGAVVVEVDEVKRDAAMRAGALAAIDGAAPDAGERLLAAAGGPVAAVIDFVGAPSTVGLSLGVLAKGGTLIAVGLYGGELPLSLPLLPLRAITVRGSYVGTLAELDELMRLAAAAGVAGVPTHVRPLDQATATLRDLKAGKLVGRAILRP